MVLVLSLPLAIAMNDRHSGVTSVAWAGGGVWLVGFLGETLADWQLDRFRKKSKNAGHPCQTGLWRYSRHPNYFFEWLLWCGYALFALPSPWGLLGIVSPALIIYFLFRVTGIPATEAHLLKSRGQEYLDYQRTTNAFFPWFPRV